MRYYSYSEPGETDMQMVKTILSEKEILAEYWNYWSDRMKQGGFASQISKERCIEDWCMIHWASEEDVFRFKDGRYIGKQFVVADFHHLDPEMNTVELVCVNDQSLQVEGWYNVMTDLEKINGSPQTHNFTLR